MRTKQLNVHHECQSCGYKYDDIGYYLKTKKVEYTRVTNINEITNELEKQQKESVIVKRFEIGNKQILKERTGIKCLQCGTSNNLDVMECTKCNDPMDKFEFVHDEVEVYDMRMINIDRSKKTIEMVRRDSIKQFNVSYPRFCNHCGADDGEIVGRCERCGNAYLIRMYPACPRCHVKKYQLIGKAR